MHANIMHLYKAKSPTGRKVAALIQVEPTNNSQSNVVEYLQRAIRSFFEDLLMRFLRFATGSDSLGVPNISVQFTSLAGLQRRIIAHTCTATLDVPVTYANYRVPLGAPLSSIEIPGTSITCNYPIGDDMAKFLKG